MATIMTMEWPGITQDQYTRVLDNLGMDSNPPKGGILHVAGFVGGSLHVTDVWESQQHFEQFQRERLNTAVQKAGITTQPKVQFYPAYNVYTPNIETVQRLGKS